MTYRKLGLLSLGLAAVAALTVYATTTTNAQPPLGSTNRNAHAHDHAHDHNHEGHNHSHTPSADAQPSDPVVVPAPSGGPPPLPGQQPNPSTRQDAAPQREPSSNNQADSPPTLMPLRPDSDYVCPQGSYSCPNAGKYREAVPRGRCPLDADYDNCPLESREGHFVTPYFPPRHAHNHGQYDVGASCEYGTYGFPMSHGLDEPCFHGAELDGRGLLHYGH